jgi:hypothetical protein
MMEVALVQMVVYKSTCKGWRRDLIFNAGACHSYTMSMLNKRTHPPLQYASETLQDMNTFIKYCNVPH